MQQSQSRREDFEASGHVFTKPGGGHYHPQVISKMLARASEEAGLSRLTAHGLRHTSATLVLDSDVAPTMQSEAADRLGAALFGDV